MRFPSGMLFGIFLAAIFLLLVRLEPELSNTGQQNTEVLLQAFQTAEKMHLEANHSFQLHDTLNRFRERLFSESESIFNDKIIPGFMTENLPDYDLAIAKFDFTGHVTRITQLNGQLNPDLIKAFIKFDMMYVSKPDSDVFENPIFKAELSAANAMLQQLIGNRGDTVSIMQLRSARMCVYRSDEGRVGFYWDHQLLENGEKVYMFCRLNLAKLQHHAPFELVLRRYGSSSMHCAFFDTRKNEFLRASGLENFTRTRAFASVERACRRFKDLKGRENFDSIISSAETGAEIAVIGREVPGTSLVPVVIAAQSAERNFSLARNENLAVFFLVCLGLLVFVQTVSFGRGLRLNVGKVLIITSLLAIFMPFMMGRSIFKLILSETSLNENLKLERELHNVVSGLDSGVRLFHANLFQNFLRVLGSDETIMGLRSAQEKQRLLEASGTVSVEDLTGASELILAVSDKSFAPFEEEIVLNKDRGRRANAVMVMGPYDFMRFYDRFKLAVVGHVRDSENDSMFLLLNLYRMMLEPFFPQHELAEGLATLSRKDKAMEVQRLKYEEVRDQVAGAIGIEKFFELFSNFEGLNMMRTTLGITHFSVFPLRWHGMIHYFCGIGWDEYTIGEMYLKNVFANIKSMYKNSAEVRKNSIFTLIDPAFYFARKPVFLQGFGGLRGDTIHSGTSESPRLGMFIKAAYRSKRPAKYKTDGEKSFLYQVNAGRYFTLYTIGALQETTHLKKIESWRSIIFLAGLATFLLFAVFAAVNISRSFTGPLEHLLWGISMIEKTDYSVKLKDSREDEFGSISRAFNFMTKRLREKDTLGKFVSESVRKLARSPELFRVAQQGSETEVTILFADLEGFSAFAAEAEEWDVQRKLEFSLEQFFKYADEFGGEVDKVIGEKLLIIFPHSRLGRKNAAVAATRLVKKIIAAFKGEKDLKPVFGLNSGVVISGIIGTPAVRMDNTVIGDPVNVAARLCSLADSRKMPVIISGEIREVLGRNYHTHRIEVEKIRGKKQEVEVFSLEP